jgi:hypothetical protein
VGKNDDEASCSIVLFSFSLRVQRSSFIGIDGTATASGAGGTVEFDEHERRGTPSGSAGTGSTSDLVDDRRRGDQRQRGSGGGGALG